jgi:SAM-dependent methyltransferase
MQSEIDRFFAQDVQSLVRSMEDLDARIPANALPIHDDLLEELTAAINASLAACARLESRFLETGNSPAALKEVQARYREAIWPLISKSWCMNRSIAKPRGYPGDYQLLTVIYNRKPVSTGLGGYLDRYWQNLTLARAVVGRMLALRGFLVEELPRRQGKTSVLNVACGACREYTDEFHMPADSVVALTCLDNDEEALNYVRSEVAPAMPENLAVDFVRYNALRMTSAAANLRRFGASDIIYSVGLCDYIPDEYLIPLLAGWRQSLAEGGLVYVAFKDCLLYDKTEYQWLLDWFFFQRTEEDCRKLFLAAGYDADRIETSRDETGVIINFACRPETPARRIDRAGEHSLGQHLESIPVATPGPIAGAR